ncbi:MAG: hypothetical protein MMC33_001195 [Icmadophila ericetorum]|nr:hypothetical protein [Icmadophila ericetorum]
MDPAKSISSQVPVATALTSSSLSQLRASASNFSAYLNPSPKDLLMVLPRIIIRAGSFTFITVPEQLDNIFGLRAGGRVIAEATREGAHNMASAALSSAALVQGNAGENVGAIATETIREQASTLRDSFSFQHIRNFGGVFSYITSKWALGCFTIAIILNRTQIYASARRHLDLSWPIRLALRIVPMVLFAMHAYNLLQALHCQMSPQYPEMKYGNPDKHILLDFAADGGLLYRIASILLFWQSDKGSCLAVGMIASEEDPGHLKGSLSYLWPIFQSLCLSQFIETLSCSVQGRPLMTETGMSIFEHSLAFAEAEAMVNSHLGVTSYGLPNASTAKKSNSTQIASDAALLVTKGFLMERLNTPPEVLLMALISCLNNFTTHILGVLGLQERYRLINTGVWGLCFMTSFVWGFATFSLEAGLDAGILRFPTVCIVGFIPHLLILAGIIVCACIYTIALILSALSPPPGLPPARTLAERLRFAQENLQANVQLSKLQLNMREDFYTALLRIGFAALTAASEAVYLNEGRRIGVARWTWLEEERLDELQASRSSYSAPGGASNLVAGGSDAVAIGVAIYEEQDRSSASSRIGQSTSGYTRERTTKTLKKGSASSDSRRMGADGVGALQRGGRYILAWEFLSGIFWLFVGWLALGSAKVLEKIGIRRRPVWLARFLRKAKEPANDVQGGRESSLSTIDFWILSDKGVYSLPENDNVDVEVETRKQMQADEESWGAEEERRLDSTLYDWWSRGGWWGERDSSGEYRPLEKDDDTTSEVSLSAEQSEVDWESDDNNGGDGARTPTQHKLYPAGDEPRSRSLSPDFDLPNQLATLLDPQNSDQRQEARILAHHLSNSRIVTRSQYRNSSDLARARVLTSTRYRPSSFKLTNRSPAHTLTPLEESELLEHLILTRRAQTQANLSASNAASASDNHANWLNGAEGLGAGGPQCVVCQSEPRSI